MIQRQENFDESLKIFIQNMPLQKILENLWIKSEKDVGLRKFDYNNMKVTFSKSSFWFLTNPKNGSRSASLPKVEISGLFFYWHFMERNSFSRIRYNINISIKMLSCEIMT